MTRGLTVMIGQTLRVRKNSLSAWSITLSALVLLYILMFPSIEKIDMDALLEQYPEELLRAFGFEESAVRLDTAIGFLNTELFGFMLPLAIIFLPIGVVVHMTSKAEERGYLDALLAAPIARWQLILAASIAATVSMAVPLIAMIVVGLASAQISGVSLSLSEIGGSALSLLPMGALAGSIATVVVGASRRHGIATAVAAGAIVVMYLVQVLAGFLKFFADINFLSIFKYYSDWINKGIDWVPFLAFLAVAGVLTVFGALLFERRDVGS